jgi:hypothetical protein
MKDQREIEDGAVVGIPAECEGCRRVFAASVPGDDYAVCLGRTIVDDLSPLYCCVHTIGHDPVRFMVRPRHIIMLLASVIVLDPGDTVGQLAGWSLDAVRMATHALRESGEIDHRTAQLNGFREALVALEIPGRSPRDSI